MLHPFTVTDEDHCRPAHRLVTAQEMKGERKTPSAGLWVMWLPRFGVNNDRMTEGCTECIPSHTKLNNHCRCLHCIHCRVSLWQPLQHMRLLGSHSPTTGVYRHCSLVLWLNTTALLEATSKQSHREGCLLQLNRRKRCDQRVLQLRKMKAYCIHSVTMATIHFWSTVPCMVTMVIGDISH